VRPSDPDDEYLVSLAAASRAVIVTGDRALLALAGRVPAYSPKDFVALIQSGRS
jgi:predicted nucleic acid-binding protein